MVFAKNQFVNEIFLALQSSLEEIPTKNAGRRAMKTWDGNRFNMLILNSIKTLYYPGYNQVRGPVAVPGLRLHLEF